MNIYGVIYKITNLINEKVYIGQTHCDRGFYGRYEHSGNSDIERVYKYHKGLKDKVKNYNKHLLYSIEKYGFENFNVEKEFDVAYSQEELDELEIKYIAQFDSFKNGYNNNAGGGGNRGRFGELNSFYGKHHTKETKEYFRNLNTGKHPNEETRKKMSDNSSRYWLGKHHTEETKEKLRQSHLGKYDGENNPMYGKSWKEGKTQKEIDTILEKKQKAQPKTKVICITTGKVFNSIREASDFYNVDSSSISKCCRGKIKYSGKLEDGTKLVWSYFYE